MSRTAVITSPCNAQVWLRRGQIGTRGSVVPACSTAHPYRRPQANAYTYRGTGAAESAARPDEHRRRATIRAFTGVRGNVA